MCPLNRSDLTHYTKCYVKIQDMNGVKEKIIQNEQKSNDGGFALIPTIQSSNTIGNSHIEEVAVNDKVARVELHRLQNIG